MTLSILQILTNFQVIGTMIGYTLGLVFYNIINSLMLSVIKPLLGKFLGRDLKTFVVKVFGVKLFLGDLLGALIDFVLVIILVMFLLRVVFKDLILNIIKKKNTPEEIQTNLLKQIADFNLPLNR